MVDYQTSETNLHKQAKSSITMQRPSTYYDGSSKSNRAERENNLEGTSTCPPTRTHLPEERLTALRRTAVALRTSGTAMASDGAEVAVGADGGVRSSCVSARCG